NANPNPNPPKQASDPQKSDASQEPADVQQLKDRVKQLEQTVEELKQLIGTVESAQKQQQQQVLASDTSGGVKTIPAVLRTTPDAPPTTKPRQDGGRTLDIYGCAMLHT